MTHFKRWHDIRPIVLNLASLVSCCVAALFIRRAVATEAVGDLAAVLLEFAGLAGFVGAAFFAARAAVRAKGPGRITLRAVPLGLALAGATFVVTSYTDVSVALHALTSGDEITPTTITLGPTGEDVRVSGSLAEGATRRLTDLLATHPSVARIHLTSDGGLVDEGEGLRKLIAHYHLATFVPDYCISACTLAFLGGSTRYIMKGARVGFHSPFEQGLFGQTFIGDRSAERASYISAGVTPGFVDKAFAVSPTDVWIPEPDQLIAAHVVTAIVDRYRFPDSSLDGAETLSGAREALLRDFPVAKALDRATIDAIAGAYLASYRQGLSEGRAVDGLRAVIAAAAAKVIAKGDDDTMVAFGRFLASAMEAAETDKDCVAIGSTADLMQADETLDDGDGKADQLAIKLLAQAARARTASRQVHAAIRPKLIAGQPAEDTCAAIRNVYEHALGLPVHAAAEQIRALTLRSSPTTASPVSIVAH